MPKRLHVFTQKVVALVNLILSKQGLTKVVKLF
jgi:hypothetical protein